MYKFIIRFTIVIALFIIAVKAFGQVLKAPAPLTDSKIERTLDNGSTQKFDGNEWMIVKRGPKKPKAKVVCPVVTEVKTLEVVKVETIPPKKNSVSLLGGYGPVGLNKDLPTRVELDYDVIIGLEYRRMLNQKYSVQAIGLSNKTGLLGVGLDF